MMANAWRREATFEIRNHHARKVSLPHALTAASRPSDLMPV